jgi:AraC-like DNA-binding protein
LPAVLAALGADADAIFAAFGLASDYFGDPENVLPMATVGSLLRRAVEASGCEHLGLLVGQRATMSSLGTVGFLMQSAPTVGDALSALSRHLAVHDRGAVVNLRQDGKFAALSYRILVRDVQASEQIYTVAAMVANGMMRAMCGVEWRAHEVWLPFRPRETLLYRQAFEAPVRFDSENCSMVFATRVLARPLRSADALLHRMMAERIREIETRTRGDLLDRARDHLAAMILLPNCTREILAHRLALSRRTLTRRLAEYGVTFQQLRDAACRDAAYELLANTDKSANDVAGVLGYSDASAFTRAFQRWSGTTPSSWRASQAGRRARRR